MARVIGCAGHDSIPLRVSPLFWDEVENGRWLIAPKHPPFSVRRCCWPGTLVLETAFESETGAAAIIDFMPPPDGADLVRIVTGRSGRMVFQTEFVLRFNYGASVPCVSRFEGCRS